MLSDRRRKLIGRLAHRKTRERERQYLAEGVRCATTVLAAGAQVRFAVLSETLAADPGTALAELLRARDVETVVIADGDLGELATTRTPQGILLVCAEPERPRELPSRRPLRLLVLDGVQDPGNVGTLVRVAAGFDLAGVLALGGTADPYSPKAVRAAAGAVAQIALWRLAWAEAAPLLATAEVPLLLATRDGDDVAGARPTGSWALVLGNEGAGVRPEIAEHAAGRLAVPIGGDVDSLNVGVAGAILLYALTRENPSES